MTFFPRRVMPVVVSYDSPRWIRIATRSFHEHLPEHLILVVDNNPARGDRRWHPGVERERLWLKRQPWLVVISGGGARKEALSAPEMHGRALDRARRWCQGHDAGVMVVFEPDCLIRGRGWFDNLCGAIAGGAWMAGMRSLPFGPIKPCPSAWRVDKIHGTFAPIRREAALRHPRYAELVDEERLRWCVAEQWDFWSQWWDTGLNNWFFAAAEGRAVLLAEPEPTRLDGPRYTQRLDRHDFLHAGAGSTSGRDALDQTDDPELVRLLADDWSPRYAGGREASS